MKTIQFPKKRRVSAWKGVVSGLVGGLAASWVMGRFQTAWTKIAEEHNDSQISGPKKSESQGEEKDDATMKAAAKISENVTGKPLSKEQKKAAGPVIHYLFGSTMAAFYGAAVEFLPVVRRGMGVPFGSILFVAADEIAVPALGLSTSPAETPVSGHIYGLASHAVYGLTTETVRRLTRRLLDAA